jgi:hypothetical protein
VADQDELGVGVAGPVPPGLQPVVALASEPAGAGPVVAAPVVGELEEVHPWGHVQLFLEGGGHLAVAVDLPEAGYQVGVRHHPRGGDAVAQLVGVGIVPLELQVLDAPPQAHQTL